MENFNPYASEEYRFTENGVALSGDNGDCFIFSSGSFFAKDIVLTCRNKTLVQGRDYTLILPHKGAIQKTAMRVFAGVYIFGSTGYIPTLSAISLGSRYITNHDKLISDTANLTTKELFVKSYDEFLADDYIPPVKIIFDVDTWYGEEELCAQIEMLNNVVGSAEFADTVVWGVLNHYLMYMELLINNPIIANHLASTGNVHGHTPEEMKARRVGSNAPNTSRLFNYNKEELISTVISTLPKLTDLNSKITKSGGTVTDITLSESNSLIGGEKFVIDRHDNQMYIDSSKDIIFTAVNSGGVSKLQVTVGTNVLLLDGVEGALYFNGSEIVTDENIDALISDSSVITADIKTSDTDTVKWTGNGSSDTPLDPTINLDTYLGKGYDIVKHSPVKDSVKAISPRGAKIVVTELEKKAPTGYMLNGVMINDSIVLSKANFAELDFVEDIADADLPLSSKVKAALIGYAEKGHTHDLGDYHIDRATTSVYGLFSYGSYNAFDVSGMLPMVAEIDKAIELVNDSIDKVELSIIYLNGGTGAIIDGVTRRDNNIIIPDLPVWLYGQNTRVPLQEISLLTGDVVVIGKYWLVLDVVTLVYNLSVSYDSRLCNIGWIEVTEFGFKHELRAIAQSIASSDEEMHMMFSGTAIHPNIKIDKEYLGLTEVENRPQVPTPSDESDGYASALTAMALYSRNNTTFTYSMVLSDLIKREIAAGTFETWFSDTYTVRQFVQLKSSNIPPENISYTISNDGSAILVYGFIPSNGFNGSVHPLSPSETYPIGHQYKTHNQYNPSNYLGGVWVPVTTVDMPEELREFYNAQIGSSVELVSILPTHTEYKHILLKPNEAVNTGLAIEISYPDGSLGLEITYPQSPIRGSRFKYNQRDDIKVYALIWKSGAVLTPLVAPKYIWTRTE